MTVQNDQASSSPLSIFDINLILHKLKYFSLGNFWEYKYDISYCSRWHTLPGYYYFTRTYYRNAQMRPGGRKVNSWVSEMRVKGKCHEVFDPLFFCLKHSFVALNEWAKTVQIYSITKFEIPESAKSTVHSHGILAPIIFFSLQINATWYCMQTHPNTFLSACSLISVHLVIVLSA